MHTAGLGGLDCLVGSVVWSHCSQLSQHSVGGVRTSTAFCTWSICLRASHCIAVLPPLLRSVLCLRRSKLQQLQQLLPYVDRPNPDVPCSLSLVQTMEEVIDGVRKFGTRNRWAHRHDSPLTD